MLDIDKLQKDREEAYDVWFDRWWKKEDIEGKIKALNAKGYTNLWISFYFDCDEYTRNRLKDIRFLGKVEKKLPGFKIKYTKSQSLLSYNFYNKGIEIRWE